MRIVIKCTPHQIRLKHPVREDELVRHVIRKGEVRKVYQSLFGKPEKNRDLLELDVEGKLILRKQVCESGLDLYGFEWRTVVSFYEH
jgi:hypothetical protein